MQAPCGQVDKESKYKIDQTEECIYPKFSSEIFAKW